MFILLNATYISDHYSCNRFMNKVSAMSQHFLLSAKARTVMEHTNVQAFETKDIPMMHLFNVG